MNSFSFHFIWESLSLPHFWRIALPVKVFLVGRNFFSFSTLNISPHSLLTCKVSSEKSTDSFVGVLLYTMTFLYSCCFQKFPFYFLVLLSYISVKSSLGWIFGGNLWVSCIWTSISLYHLSTWKFLAIIPSNSLPIYLSIYPLPCPSSEMLIIHILFHLLVSYNSYRHSSLFHSVFL